MRYKTAPTNVKSVDADSGVFEAYVSVFDNVDFHGDVVRRGAFKKTLDDWAHRGAPIPVLWSHRTDDPDYNLGHVLEAKETDHGLWIKAQLDLQAPKAVTVHRQMKGGRVREFSYAYMVTDGGPADDVDAFEIRGARLFEVGPTPIGANPETELLDVKAAAEQIRWHIKAGRMLSARNESALRNVLADLQGAVTAMKSVLPEEDPPGDEEDQESTSGEEPSPETTKSLGVTMPSPSVALAMTFIDIERVGMT